MLRKRELDFLEIRGAEGAEGAEGRGGKRGRRWVAKIYAYSPISQDECNYCLLKTRTKYYENHTLKKAKHRKGENVYN